MARKKRALKPRLRKMMGTRFTDEEFDQIKRLADRDGRTEADWLRRQIRKLLQEMNP